MSAMRKKPRIGVTATCCGARATRRGSARLQLRTHVVVGHPVRDIVELAAELEVELLVIGAVGHSELYERLIGSRADRITQLAQCPVLVVK